MSKHNSMVWTARVITAVSSMRLSMYPTSSAEDRVILKNDDQMLTWWHEMPSSFALVKEVLRAWARFGVVLAHNHMARPRR